LLICHFLHILLFLHYLLLLLFRFFHTSDLFLLVNLSFLSIQFGQMIEVLSSTLLLQSSVVVESVCTQALSCVFAESKSLLILTGPRQSCVPFKIESSRWRYKELIQP
jgi:hypothetical protein